MSDDATRRRIWIQAPLGFSSGVPLYLTGSTLGAWLATADVSIKAIGVFALVALPYNLKFLWAPFLDRYNLPFLSRRRDWMVVSQLLLTVSIVALGAVDAPLNLGTAAVLAIAVALFSAGQDIVVDAYRTDLLHSGERGKGGAAYVTGYRVAMIITSTGALLMADYISWRYVYWILSSLMMVGVIATFFAPTLPAIAPPRNLKDAVVKPLAEFFSRDGAIIAIVFIMLYKLGDYVAMHMVTPFLIKELHFELTEIALLQKFVGLGATIVGAAIGGILVDRIGIRKGLLIFGFGQAIANIGYVFLALSGKSYTGLVLAIGIDNVFNGFGAAAFVAYLMSMCHHKYSAAQHALLASATSVLGRLMTATSGYIVEGIGWAGFFAATIVIAAPALGLWKWLPEGPSDAEASGAIKQPKPIPQIYRTVASGVTVAFAAASVWKFTQGNWKLGIGLAVPTLCFLAYVLVAGRTQRDDE